MKINSSLEFLYYLSHPTASIINFHNHNCYELVYYISGSGHTNINDIEYLFEEGSFALIQSGISHDERHNNKTDVLFIGFFCDNSPIKLENGIFKDNLQKDILRLLQKLKAEMLEKKAFFEFKIETILQELIIELIRILSSKPDTRGNFLHIESFLLENYIWDVDFHTLAEISGYSYHRFRHIFKQMYGLSPCSYVQELRIQNASRMLSYTTFTISRIAHENGFTSESQFCSLFKRLNSCTPGEFRKKQSSS
ncbi:MAG TPA: helix-turn-helix domain-containing protein [Ruminiclostridium sp.]